MYLLYGTIRLEVINHPLDGDWIYWRNKVGKYPGVRTRIAKLLKSQKNNCATRLEKGLGHGKLLILDFSRPHHSSHGRLARCSIS
jgi:hypothetical protein